MEARNVITAACCAAAIIASGALGALAADFYASRATQVSFGPEDSPWRTSLEIGQADGGPFLRARLSRFGLLAMTRSESIYFLAVTDSLGQPLERGVRYRMQGDMPDAGWWSLTAYGEDYQLLPSNGRYSFLSEPTQGENGTLVMIGPGADDDIATPGTGPLVLALRLYEPSAIDADSVASYTLPRIERVEP